MLVEHCIILANNVAAKFMVIIIKEPLAGCSVQKSRQLVTWEPHTSSSDHLLIVLPLHWPTLSAVCGIITFTPTLPHPRGACLYL